MTVRKRICVMDIGSNSIRMVIYEITPNKSFIPIEDIKETVRLGEGINEKKELKDEKIKLALKTIQLFKKVCLRNNVDEIVAFGTAALRIASNGEQLLKDILLTTGIDVIVFKGEDEAYFSFEGAVNTLDIQEGVVIDLGGSSLEVVHFKNREALERVSLNFGAVTLSEFVNLKDKLSKKDEERLREYIREQFQIVQWKEEIKNLPLIGVGGTVRNIGGVHLYLHNYPLELLHNYIVNVDGVKEVVDYLKDKDYKQKQDVQGLSKARADVFIGAAIAVEEVLTYFNLKELIISGYGIREGVLYERLSECGKVVKDPFEDGFKEIIEILDLNTNPKEKQHKIFKKICVALNEKYEFKGISEKVIKVVTYLYDIGKIINYTNYPLHSAYMILNLGIKGIEQKELVASALIVARGNKKYKGLEKYKEIFKDEEIEELMMLSKILNITNIFYDDLLLEENNFDIEVTKDEIIFYIKEKDEEDLKIIDLFISQKKFVNTFDRKLKFKLNK
ncbi:MULTISPECIES: Ppx/GppA family phosphatase [Cetobacterium]|uniref:Ppx/GppA family phosphatase n=1 Tax=Candidatus Cetobacterium colombiensis TaxID=3073100 RepID=A0ABU4WAF4_9FUSO|nr:Ppx/GppA family phosphatase [Candidatus Cetobacterium colombiensis]MDX8336509.1 Ppx/GppA family phosphatase [Candidatus Cetobacterium colombiensis]